MGTCTSTARRRQKQQHNQAVLKNSIVLGIKPPPPLPPLPSTAFPNRQSQHHHPLFIDIDILSSPLTKSIFHQTDTNSLIQLYSSNRNNNNNNSNTINWMASSSPVTHVPPRIPVPKSRLPVYHSSQQPTAIVSIRPKNVTSIVIQNNQTDSQRSMSITNRPPPPTAMQTRFGFIPRPTAPGLQQVGASTFASRSRSISPTSTASAKSSSSSLVSQRLSKPPKVTPNRSIPPSSTTNNPPKSKALTSPRPRDSSASRSTLQASTTAGHMRSRTPSRTSTTSPSSSVTSPPPPPPSSSAIKTDVNAIRDRYKTQKRMNFFIRRTPISTANGSPVASSIKSPEPLINNKEKKQSLNNNSKSITPPQGQSSHKDSTSTNETSSSNHPPSAHISQGNKHRQRAINMLSSASALSDVLNQDTLLEDDNCSLKSEDLMCDYEDTLTIDSASKTDQTDSCSLASSSTEVNKNQTTVINVTPTKPSVPQHQPTSKEHRSATIAKCSPATNGSLRESLDELNRLSNRMDNGIDNEHNRLMTRSVSLKPPPSYLPPLEDAEQITMDIESYRQVMKDVMIVKTILHQLDRLLKHSDGANMTDSMIGSFHEFHDAAFSSRRYSISNMEGNLRTSIDENSSYDDLLKEIIALRKEKEQDKQTIKLLQEQMYKYSSQTNA